MRGPMVAVMQRRVSADVYGARALCAICAARLPAIVAPSGASAVRCEACGVVSAWDAADRGADAVTFDAATLAAAFAGAVAAPMRAAAMSAKDAKDARGVAALLVALAFACLSDCEALT